MCEHVAAAEQNYHLTVKLSENSVPSHEENWKKMRNYLIIYFFENVIPAIWIWKLKYSINNSIISLKRFLRATHPVKVEKFVRIISLKNSNELRSSRFSRAYGVMNVGRTNGRAQPRIKRSYIVKNLSRELCTCVTSVYRCEEYPSCLQLNLRRLVVDWPFKTNKWKFYHEKSWKRIMPALFDTPFNELLKFWFNSIYRNSQAGRWKQT